MKNLFKAALLVMFIAVAQTSQSKDMTINSNLTNPSEKLDAAGTQKLINRLEELKAMDKSSMTRAEKRAMRKEVKAIQKTMDSGGVYLSVGVVILIIVLLIILL